MKTSEQDIRVLAQVIKDHDLTVVEYKDADFSLRLEKGGVQAPLFNEPNEQVSNDFEVSQSEKVETEINKEEQVEAANTVDLTDSFKLTSPIVGNFYSSKKPGDNPFVKVGDHVSEGQTVAIVEAMKVMNEIKSPVNGTIVKVNCKDGEFVDTLSELMLIDEE